MSVTNPPSGPPSNSSTMREQLKAAHNRFHGRFDTHIEVAKKGKWVKDWLDKVLIEDEELFYDEIESLLQSERQRWTSELEPKITAVLINHSDPCRDQILTIIKELANPPTNSGRQ